MNTCKCQLCLGKKCHYSAYYHREEGFDAMHENLKKINQCLMKKIAVMRQELGARSKNDKGSGSLPLSAVNAATLSTALRSQQCESQRKKLRLVSIGRGSKRVSAFVLVPVSHVTTREEVEQIAREGGLDIQRGATYYY